MRGIPHWMPWQERQGWVTLASCPFITWTPSATGSAIPSASTAPYTDPRTQFPHTDGIASYILEYASGLRAIAVDDTWTGPPAKGAYDIGVDDALKDSTAAKGNIGWCRTRTPHHHHL